MREEAARVDGKETEAEVALWCSGGARKFGDAKPVAREKVQAPGRKFNSTIHLARHHHGRPRCCPGRAADAQKSPPKKKEGEGSLCRQP